MLMETTTLRMEKGTRHRLQVVAARESLRRGRRVTWASLVRALIESHLLRSNVGLPALVSSQIGGDEQK